MNIHALYRPILTHFRSKRMRAFMREFQIDDNTSILDVGGMPLVWELLPFRPSVTILNLNPPDAQTREADFPWVIGDACDLPFADSSFDIVFSNSVIEHLGEWSNQVRMASEISRVGKRHFVQTPNRNFPVEPHLLTPLIHFLPRFVQQRLIRNFTLFGWITRPTPEQVRDMLNEIKLLNGDDMMRLFPDGQLRTERFCGVTKSLVSVRKNISYGGGNDVEVKSQNV